MTFDIDRIRRMSFLGKLLSFLIVDMVGTAETDVR
jgi:hypothetical protein